jgi:hypothetical protein
MNSEYELQLNFNIALKYSNGQFASAELLTPFWNGQCLSGTLHASFQVQSMCIPLVRGEKSRANFLPLKKGGTRYELENNGYPNFALHAVRSLLLLEDDLGRSTSLVLAEN